MRRKRAARKPADDDAAEVVMMRLYIVDNAPNSLKAIANLAAICEEFLADRFRLEVIDVLKQPLRALADGVLVTPSLLKVSPKPTANIVGDLGNQGDVMRALRL